ncbi:hypothetical protein BOTBODRAFT_132675 [Botryobasidium botryosum FD-172 SS1]|uniref:Aminopeptidase P N-terminal domain-containing protein n=1 Tax=Botryobasidium botryosum (strain FD-172 SS1) TaxID=930990 RepID=A0A067MEK0_BOTB1|nr:hypothetical protein BOTBODRAFT_132675 [Botryobasidium botryosum FD-172 SS1]
MKSLMRHRGLCRLPPTSLAVSACRSYARSTPPASKLATPQGSPSDASLHPRKPALYGQPTYDSHPHILREDEVTPGIPKSEYERRRRELMARLPDRSMVLCVAAPVKYMSQGIFYKYRQASELWYLTGLQETESAVVLEKDSSSRGYKMTLFVQSKDQRKELWEGPRTGVNAAATLFGADEAKDVSYLSKYLKSSISKVDTVYVDSSFPTQTQTRSFLNYLRPSSDENPITSILSNKIRPLKEDLQMVRTIKSEHEIKIMKKAGAISGTAHAKTMRFTQPGQSESSLAAHFEYLCALEGAQRPAYVPVVASGANALFIHYTSNEQIMCDGELILMDAGCEYNGYASDITRTWPVSGKFTGPQRDLYQAVLNAEKALILQCKESAGESLHTLHQASSKILLDELRQIGFDIGPRELDRLYPHYLSHPIGIDLHESGKDQRHWGLKSGTVITVEPGVYVPPDPAFPKHFHNIGIRIEDEVLVQQDHAVVLSANAPKEIVDVEATCQGLLGVGPY